MTVTNTSYSFIDDVWGSSTEKPRKKKGKKKTEEYDDIMHNYAQLWAASPYDKSVYSGIHPHGRVRPGKIVDEDDETFSNEDALETNAKFSSNKYLRYKEDMTEKGAKEASLIADKERQYLDLTIYVFSGIALIFILEQFIQIGVHLK